MIVENLQGALKKCEQEVKELKKELEEIKKCREHGMSGSPLDYLETIDTRDLAMYEELHKLNTLNIHH